MGSKPTYEELEKRIQALEEVAPESKQKTIGSESETLYRGLISEMIFGYAQHEIISRKT